MSEEMNLYKRCKNIFKAHGADMGGGGSSDAIQYIPQELTEAQKMQARKNQGLYYEMIDTFTWDGDTTGLDCIMGAFFRVPAFENVDPNGVLQFTVYFNGECTTIDSAEMVDISSSVGADDGIIIMAMTDSEMQWFVVVTKDVDIDIGEGLRHYKKGCYSIYMEDTGYVSSITGGYVEKIPEKFLDIAPKDVPREIPLYLDSECTIASPASLFTVGDSRLYVRGQFDKDWVSAGLCCKMSDMPEFVRDIVYNRYKVFATSPSRVMFQSENRRAMLVGFTNNPDECEYLYFGYGIYDDEPGMVHVNTLELLPDETVV